MCVNLYVHAYTGTHTYTHGNFTCRKQTEVVREMQGGRGSQFHAGREGEGGGLGGEDPIRKGPPPKVHARVPSLPGLPIVEADRQGPEGKGTNP